MAEMLTGTVVEWPHWARCVVCIDLFKIDPATGQSQHGGQEGQASSQSPTEGTTNINWVIAKDIYSQCDFFLLPCLHFVCCVQCLEKLKKTDGTATPDDDEEDCSCSSCGEEFSLDLVVARGTFRPLEILGVVEEPGPMVELPKLCESCIRNRNAVGRCDECNILLCSICVDTHKVMRLTYTHQLTSDNTKELVPTTKLCSSHPNRKVIIYCETCDAKLCDLCQTDHQSHRTQDIPKFQENIKAELLRRVSRTNKIGTSCELAELNLDGIIPQEHDLIQQAGRQLQNLVEAISGREEELKREIRKSFSEKIAELRVPRQALEETKKQTSQLGKLVSSLTPQTDVNLMLRLRRVLENQFVWLEDRGAKVLGMPTPSPIIIQTDLQAMDKINKLLQSVVRVSTSRSNRSESAEEEGPESILPPQLNTEGVSEAEDSPIAGTSTRTDATQPPLHPHSQQPQKPTQKNMRKKKSLKNKRIIKQEPRDTIEAFTTDDGVPLQSAFYVDASDESDTSDSEDSLMAMGVRIKQERVENQDGEDSMNNNFSDFTSGLTLPQPEPEPPVPEMDSPLNPAQVSTDENENEEYAMDVDVVENGKKEPVWRLIDYAPPSENSFCEKEPPEGWEVLSQESQASVSVINQYEVVIPTNQDEDSQTQNENPREPHRRRLNSGSSQKNRRSDEGQEGLLFEMSAVSGESVEDSGIESPQNQNHKTPEELAAEEEGLLNLSEEFEQEQEEQTQDQIPDDIVSESPPVVGGVAVRKSARMQEKAKIAKEAAEKAAEAAALIQSNANKTDVNDVIGSIGTQCTETGTIGRAPEDKSQPELLENTTTPASAVVENEILTSPNKPKVKASPRKKNIQIQGDRETLKAVVTQTALSHDAIMKDDPVKEAGIFQLMKDSSPAKKPNVPQRQPPKLPAHGVGDRSRQSQYQFMESLGLISPARTQPNILRRIGISLPPQNLKTNAQMAQTRTTWPYQNQNMQPGETASSLLIQKATTASTATLNLQSGTVGVEPPPLLCDTSSSSIPIPIPSACDNLSHSHQSQKKTKKTSKKQKSRGRQSASSVTSELSGVSWRLSEKKKKRNKEQRQRQVQNSIGISIPNEDEALQPQLQPECPESPVKPSPIVWNNTSVEKTVKSPTAMKPSPLKPKKPVLEPAPNLPNPNVGLGVNVKKNLNKSQTPSDSTLTHQVKTKTDSVEIAQNENSRLQIEKQRSTKSTGILSEGTRQEGVELDPSSPSAPPPLTNGDTLSLFLSTSTSSAEDSIHMSPTEGTSGKGKRVRKQRQFPGMIPSKDIERHISELQAENSKKKKDKDKIKKQSLQPEPATSLIDLPDTSAAAGFPLVNGIIVPVLPKQPLKTYSMKYSNINKTQTPVVPTPTPGPEGNLSEIESATSSSSTKKTGTGAGTNPFVETEGTFSSFSRPAPAPGSRKGPSTTLRVHAGAPAALRSETAAIKSALRSDAAILEAVNGKDKKTETKTQSQTKVEVATATATEQNPVQMGTLTITEKSSELELKELQQQQQQSSERAKGGKNVEAGSKRPLKDKADDADETGPKTSSSEPEPQIEMPMPESRKSSKKQKRGLDQTEKVPPLTVILNQSQPMIKKPFQKPTTVVKPMQHQQCQREQVEAEATLGIAPEKPDLDLNLNEKLYQTELQTQPEPQTLEEEKRVPKCRIKINRSNSATSNKSVADLNLDLEGELKGSELESQPQVPMAVPVTVGAEIERQPARNTEKSESENAKKEILVEKVSQAQSENSTTNTTTAIETERAPEPEQKPAQEPEPETPTAKSDSTSTCSTEKIFLAEAEPYSNKRSSNRRPIPPLQLIPNRQSPLTLTLTGGATAVQAAVQSDKDVSGSEHSEPVAAGAKEQLSEKKDEAVEVAVAVEIPSIPPPAPRAITPTNINSFTTICKQVKVVLSKLAKNVGVNQNPSVAPAAASAPTSSSSTGNIQYANGARSTVVRGPSPIPHQRQRNPSNPTHPFPPPPFQEFPTPQVPTQSSLNPKEAAKTKHNKNPRPEVSTCSSSSSHIPRTVIRAPPKKRLRTTSIEGIFNTNNCKDKTDSPISSRAFAAHQPQPLPPKRSRTLPQLGSVDGNEKNRSELQHHQSQPDVTLNGVGLNDALLTFATIATNQHHFQDNRETDRDRSQQSVIVKNKQATVAKMPPKAHVSLKMPDSPPPLISLDSVHVVISGRECVVCFNEESGQLTECGNCSSAFHLSCHIPALISSHSYPSGKKFHCFFCRTLEESVNQAAQVDKNIRWNANPRGIEQNRPLFLKMCKLLSEVFKLPVGVKVRRSRRNLKNDTNDYEFPHPSPNHLLQVIRKRLVKMEPKPFEKPDDLMDDIAYILRVLNEIEKLPNHMVSLKEEFEGKVCALLNKYC